MVLQQTASLICLHTYLNVVLYAISSFAVHRRLQPFVTFFSGCYRSNEVITFITSCVIPRLLLIISVVSDFSMTAICHAKVISTFMFSNHTRTRAHSTPHSFLPSHSTTCSNWQCCLATKVPLTSLLRSNSLFTENAYDE